MTKGTSVYGDDDGKGRHYLGPSVWTEINISSDLSFTRRDTLTELSPGVYRFGKFSPTRRTFVGLPKNETYSLLRTRVSHSGRPRKRSTH